MGLSQYLPIIAAAGAGRAKGNVNREAIEREELQQALVEHHRKKQEELESSRIGLEDRRLTAADKDRDLARSARLAARADAQERADLDRAERAREADQRDKTTRQNRANTSSKPPQALNPDLRRQQFIDHRRTELMKAQRLGSKQRQLSATDAQRQAAQEADEVFGPVAGAPPRAAPPDGITLGAPDDAAAQLRASAERAIANGADPGKVHARLDAELRKLKGAPARRSHVPSPE